MFPARRLQGTGLAFAADLESRRDTLEVLDAIVDLVDVIKVNLPLILRVGIDFIGELKRRYDRPVFADFKVADIPFTNHGIISAARAVGAAAVMVHGIVGRRALGQAVAAGGAETAIIVQTEFTHDGAYLAPEVALDLAQLAVDAGCRGVQAPGNRPSRVAAIRAVVGDDLTIICCGVGVQGGGFHSAMQAGADYVIVGRAIHEAIDPRSAAQRIVSGELG